MPDPHENPTLEQPDSTHSGESPAGEREMGMIRRRRRIERGVSSEEQAYLAGPPGAPEAQGATAGPSGTRPEEAASDPTTARAFWSFGAPVPRRAASRGMD
jgi:hypothetical protein